MSAEKPQNCDHTVTLIHHAANCGDAAPAGSISALGKCLAGGTAYVEIDVVPLTDGSLALLHDQDLESQTSGKGKAPQLNRAQVENFYYTIAGEITREKIGFLEDVIPLLRAYPATRRLQIDFKPFTPLTQGMLQDFLALIEPVIDRIQVTSVADWAIRSLAQAAPNLSLGFDPLLYLDCVDPEPRPENIPPFRVGAYGFLDDHPLSAFQWGSLGDYFAARANALLAQVPQSCEWFIRAEVLKSALDAGFDWIDFLHQQGSTVDGWTIDAAQPEQAALAKFLVEHGIDMLTTDRPSLLAPHLPGEVVF